ncbi:MAG: GAF domain-containing protein [Lewinella sp.]|nr:GAF domain-containing protein [Lewinella sp.]
MEQHFKGADKLYSVEYDLNNCDQEPIHIIRIVQGHACLLGVDLDTLLIGHASENTAEILGVGHQQLLSGKIDDYLPGEVMSQLLAGKDEVEFSDINPVSIQYFGGQRLDQSYNMVAHLQGRIIILEFEAQESKLSSSQFLQKSDRAIQSIQSSNSLQALFNQTVHEIRQLTGYDRVMLYQFDKDHNGTVIAEAREASLEPFLNLRYPATDIPRQARALFVRNQVRIIVDTSARPAMIRKGKEVRDQEPLDLSDSVARGVSPIHIEYLQNMGVRASMSVSIIVDEQLWGLIACHHYQPKLVDYRLRNMIKFLGRIISGHLALQEAHDFREQILQTNIVRSQLFEQMSRDWDIFEGLLKQQLTLLDLNQSSGAAIFLDGKLHTIGECPSSKDIIELIDWLSKEVEEPIFHTNQLSVHWPPAHNIKRKASGLLALQIAHTPPEYILWFRPEVIQTVNWAGNPKKSVTQEDGQIRLSPRKSFEKWKQLVKDTAKPWSKHHITSAIALRNDIKEIIIQKYQEIRQLNHELTEAYSDLESFSYSVSHDLRAPLRTIEGFSEILREDYYDKLDDYGRYVLDTISSSVGKMNSFINDLLALSKISRTDLLLNKIDLRKELQFLWDSLDKGQRTSLRFDVQDDLPVIYAEVTALRQLLQNLLSNAVKYTRHTAEPVIEVGGYTQSGKSVIYVRDNGVGFDQKYEDKIFEVFSRLVSDMEYEGTGVGLAIVKKVMEKHQGRVWVESKEGKGSTFYCEFPDFQSPD